MNILLPHKLNFSPISSSFKSKSNDKLLKTLDIHEYIITHKPSSSHFQQLQKQQFR